MANTKGGTILVGVRDVSREVVGITPNQRVVDAVERINIVGAVATARGDLFSLIVS